MSFFYQDIDGGSDANDGTTWALAKLTLEGLLAVMSAGDAGYIQGAATDTAAASRTFTSPGTIGNPCKLIGVVDGTTNTGVNVVVADLAVTLPKIECTGSANDLTFEGFSLYSNVHMDSSDKTFFTGLTENTFVNSKLSLFDDIRSTITTAPTRVKLVGGILETTGTAGVLSQVEFEMLGGSILSTTSTPLIDDDPLGAGVKAFVSVDISGIGSTALIAGDGSTSQIRLKNCKIPSVFNIYTSTPLDGSTFEAVGCSDASSVAATDSIQDYQYEDAYGTIDLEVTAVRTGGADDDATGAFSYAMTPAANATLESSGATLKSPWMSVWVDGGSNTLTVYIANDSASTDYNLDEAWVEFYTPDAGDTAQYDQTFDAGDARLLDSTTAITDDTGSVWGSGANNHQQFSATVTTGYTGWAYARLHLAKRSATPDTLFLDPRIEVS